MSHKNSFIADQRGAVAKALTLRGLLADQRGFAASAEFLVIASFLFVFLLLPIADMGVGTLRYMHAKQAMRDLGALVQYNQPPDLTSVGTWTLPATTVGTFSVTKDVVFPTSENQINITVSCGTPPEAGAVAGPACTPADLVNVSTPKYVWMGVVVKLNPIILKTMTGGNLGYTERLQWPLPS